VVSIPAGEFVRGSDMGYSNEGPQQLVYLDAFEIDQYEITNIQYSRFLLATGNKAPSYWIDGEYPDGQADYPVVGIHWRNANEYCTWAGKRLPTEAEWEKACRGPNGNIYPWGNEWNLQRANVDSVMASLSLVKQDGSPTAWAYAWQLLQTTPGTGQLGLQPVGSYPTGVSFYGVMDLVGNASEWVFDWYNWSDYSNLPLRNPINLEPRWNHGVRGSAWHDPAGTVDQVRIWSRCSTRSSAHSIADPRTGFRCARSVSEEK
jgi:iron(II)-dependent oxidoreductase